MAFLDLQLIFFISLKRLSLNYLSLLPMWHASVANSSEKHCETHSFLSCIRNPIVMGSSPPPLFNTARLPPPHQRRCHLAADHCRHCLAADASQNLGDGGGNGSRGGGQQGGQGQG